MARKDCKTCPYANGQGFINELKKMAIVSGIFEASPENRQEARADIQKRLHPEARELPAADEAEGNRLIKERPLY